MTWLTKLTGISHETTTEIHNNLALDGQTLTCRLTGDTLTCGRLEIPTLNELRVRLATTEVPTGKLTVTEHIGNVQHLHITCEPGAVFQVASQFNLLEMISPSITPEHGVGIYENDLTQGPACAIACGAGTIYRNYFVPIEGQIGGNIGQTTGAQVDCLQDLGAELGNHDGQLWEMRNGYALATATGLDQITDRITNSTEAELDVLRGHLRIGVQSGTEVTISDVPRPTAQTVTQVFCSALPVAYSPHGSARWQAFAELILTAAYEATFIAAIVSRIQTGNRNLYLTLLGGGAFGNQDTWIQTAIERSLTKFAATDLQVTLVSYGKSNPIARSLVATT